MALAVSISETTKAPILHDIHMPQENQFTPGRSEKTNRDVSRFALFLAYAILLLELVHASAGVCQLLLSGIERMTLGADFNVKVLLGGTRFPRFSACTPYDGCTVFRMDTLLHDAHLAFPVALSVTQT